MFARVGELENERARERLNVCMCVCTGKSVYLCANERECVSV